MHYLADLSLLFHALRQMLFCRVTLGKSFLQFSAMKMAHAPPGHHSVIGRPSVNGLAYAEYVIYRGEQVNMGEKKRLQNLCLLNTVNAVILNTWNTCCVTVANFSSCVSFRPTQSTSSPTRSLNRRLRPSLLQELSRSHSYFNSHTHKHTRTWCSLSSPLYCKCLKTFLFTKTHFQTPIQ